MRFLYTDNLGISASTSSVNTSNNSTLSAREKLKLNNISKKIADNTELSEEDLKFLNSLDKNILSKDIQNYLNNKPSDEISKFAKEYLGITSFDQADSSLITSLYKLQQSCQKQELKLDIDYKAIFEKVKNLPDQNTKDNFINNIQFLANKLNDQSLNPASKKDITDKVQQNWNSIKNNDDMVSFIHIFSNNSFKGRDELVDNIIKEIDNLHSTNKLIEAYQSMGVNFDNVTLDEFVDFAKQNNINISRSDLDKLLRYLKGDVSLRDEILGNKSIKKFEDTYFEANKLQWIADTKFLSASEKEKIYNETVNDLKKRNPDIYKTLADSGFIQKLSDQIALEVKTEQTAIQQSVGLESQEEHSNGSETLITVSDQEFATKTYNNIPENNKQVGQTLKGLDNTRKEINELEEKINDQAVASNKELSDQITAKINAKKAELKKLEADLQSQISNIKIDLNKLIDKYLSGKYQENMRSAINTLLDPAKTSFDPTDYNKANISKALLLIYSNLNKLDTDKTPKEAKAKVQTIAAQRQHLKNLIKASVNNFNSYLYAKLVKQIDKNFGEVVASNLIHEASNEELSNKAKSLRNDILEITEKLLKQTKETAQKAEDDKTKALFQMIVDNLQKSLGNIATIETIKKLIENGNYRLIAAAMVEQYINNNKDSTGKFSTDDVKKILTMNVNSIAQKSLISSSSEENLVKLINGVEKTGDISKVQDIVQKMSIGQLLDMYKNDKNKLSASTIAMIEKRLIEQVQNGNLPAESLPKELLVKAGVDLDKGNSTGMNQLNLRMIA